MFIYTIFQKQIIQNAQMTRVCAQILIQKNHRRYLISCLIVEMLKVHHFYGKTYKILSITYTHICNLSKIPEYLVPWMPQRGSVITIVIFYLVQFLSSSGKLVLFCSLIVLCHSVCPLSHNKNTDSYELWLHIPCFVGYQKLRSTKILKLTSRYFIHLNYYNFCVSVILSS